MWLCRASNEALMPLFAAIACRRRQIVFDCHHGAFENDHTRTFGGSSPALAGALLVQAKLETISFRRALRRLCTDCGRGIRHALIPPVLGTSWSIREAFAQGSVGDEAIHPFSRHSGRREAAIRNLEILRCAIAHHSSMLRIAPE